MPTGIGYKTELLTQSIRQQKLPTAFTQSSASDPAVRVALAGNAGGRILLWKDTFQLRLGALYHVEL